MYMYIILGAMHAYFCSTSLPCFFNNPGATEWTFPPNWIKSFLLFEITWFWITQWKLINLYKLHFSPYVPRTWIGIYLLTLIKQTWLILRHSTSNIWFSCDHVFFNWLYFDLFLIKWFWIDLIILIVLWSRLKKACSVFWGNILITG